MTEKKPANTLPPGSVFGRYTIVRLLGSGGMGAVYEASHADLKKRVAIKILHPEYAMHAEVHARFLREGESASRIRHPHVVDVTDFGIHEGTPFLVMEYLEGESLSAMLRRETTLPVERVADFLLPVCAAVAAAHEAQVIHRDLKPDNVYLERKRNGEWVPKVVDFGISKVTEEQQDVSSLTSTGAMIGTPSYMSPEQMRTSKTVDARTDQYALGVMMYECVTGEKPFIAETLYEIMNKIVHGEYDPPRTKNPSLPEAFEAVVMRAMHVDPAQRFATVRGLGHALLPFASERQRLLWDAEFADAAEEAPPVVAPATVASGRPPSAPPVATVGAHTLGETGREIDARSVPTRSASRVWVGAGAVVLVGIVGVGYRMAHTTAAPIVPAAAETVRTTTTTPASPSPPTDYEASVTVQPSVATIDLDGEPAGTGTFTRRFAHDGTQHALHVHAPGYEDQTVLFRDQPPPADIVLRQSAAPPPVEVAAPLEADAGAHNTTVASAPGAGHTEPHHHGEHAHADAGTHAAAQPEEHSGGSVGTNGAAILQ